MEKLESQTLDLKDFPKEIVFMICDNLEYRDVVSLIESDENLEYLRNRKKYWEQYYEKISCLYDIDCKHVKYFYLTQLVKLEDITLDTKIYYSSQQKLQNLYENLHILFKQSNDNRYKDFLSKMCVKNTKHIFERANMSMRSLTGYNLKCGGVKLLELYIKHGGNPIVNDDMDMFNYCMDTSQLCICDGCDVEQLKNLHNYISWHCSNLRKCSYDSIFSTADLATKYKRFNMQCNIFQHFKENI